MNCLDNLEDKPKKSKEITYISAEKCKKVRDKLLTELQHGLKYLEDK